MYILFFLKVEPYRGICYITNCSEKPSHPLGTTVCPYLKTTKNTLTFDQFLNIVYILSIKATNLCKEKQEEDSLSSYIVVYYKIVQIISISLCVVLLSETKIKRVIHTYTKFTAIKKT